MQRGFVDGAVGQANALTDAVRGRAFDLLKRMVDRAAGSLRALYAELEERSDRTPTPEEQREFEGLMYALDAIAHEIYFASGAFDERRGSTSEDAHPLPDEVKRRFLQEAGPLLDTLAECGQPRIAYQLLRTLEAYVPIDPLGVWLRIAQVVRQARVHGVQLRHMAADLAVELVERYLADYRSEIWGSPKARLALADILDGFVEVGWPNALRLAYRLEQIYR